MEPMMAVLKNGRTVEIDTSYLFNNQYNTIPSDGKKNGERIFDKDILRIINDARIDMGVCKYCGAMVRRGEEERHFADKESGKCDGCFWYRRKTISQENSDVEHIITDLGDGTYKETYTRTTTTVFHKCCTFNDDVSSNRSACVRTACRAYGIEWFTPENTFFLRFPNGFNGKESAKLIANGMFESPKVDVYEEGKTYCYRYRKLIGSYVLMAYARYVDGAIFVDEFRIFNCRRDYRFRLEDGDLYIKDWHGWERIDHFRDVPAHMEKTILDIVKGVLG